MSNKKEYSPREAAQAVLKKAHEILAKSETLRKYETEMKKEPSKASKLNPKDIERDYKDFEVKSGKSKSSDDKRQAKQTSPSKNPKEEAEGNNQPDGAEPPYEFKDKIKEELAKEKAAMGKAENPDKDADAELGEKVENDVEEHFKENKDAEKKEGHKLMVKSCPNCGNMHKSEDFAELCGELEEMSKAEKMNKKYYGFKAVEEKAKESGASDPAAVAAAAGRKKYGKKAFQEAAAHGHKMHKEESKHDRCVEDVKENSPEVKNPHAVCVAEGVKPAKWSKGAEQPNGEEKAFIPARLVGSAKLSKFMEHMHAKRKAKMSSPAEEKSHEQHGTSDEKAGEAQAASIKQAIKETSEK